MTPEYASPEQVRGTPVGVCSDVYALGLLLYLLLTGRLPYAPASGDLSELAMAICEQQPLKPSEAAGVQAPEMDGESSGSLRRQLAGDLDAIVLKALDKRPLERYQSVNGMSLDIERFLQGVPVGARPAAFWYSVRKFLTRKWPVVSAAATGAAIVAALGIGLSLVERTSEQKLPNASESKPAPRRAGLNWNRVSFEAIGDLGDAAPGGGTIVTSFEPYALNSSGDVVFTANVSTRGQAVFLKPKGMPLVELARAGRRAPEGSVFAEHSIGYHAMNRSGDAAFAFSLQPKNPPELKGYDRAALFRYSRATHSLIPIIVPGITQAPGFGVFQSAGAPAMNNSGEIVFPGLVRTSAGLPAAAGLGQGIFLIGRDGRISKVVAPGDAAPHGSTFDYAVNPSINDRGDVAFGAHVAGGDCISIRLFGPGCTESIYLKTGARGVLESVAHQGDMTPYGDAYLAAWGAVLNNAGDLVFIGEFRPAPDFRVSRGIFMHSRGTSTGIARTGDLTPDGRKIAAVNPTYTAGNYSISDHGDVSFNALLEDGASVLYVYSRNSLHLIAGTGTVIPGIGTISSVAEPVMGGALNSNGQVFFWAKMMDGRGVLLLASAEKSGAVD